MGTRRAVVTGASSGIGEAVVRVLRSTGWDVVGVARRADRLRALEEETGAVATTWPVEGSTMSAVLSAAAERYSPLTKLRSTRGDWLTTNLLEEFAALYARERLYRQAEVHLTEESASFSA